MRHKVLTVIAVRQISRVGGKLSQAFLIVFYDQYSQHFSSHELVVPLWLSKRTIHHLLSGNHAKLMRNVMKRISKPRGGLNATHIVLEMMKQ